MKGVVLERISRTKLVNFRLSDEEAAYLIEKADASGARSVSEYVRVTALQFAETNLGRRQTIRAGGESQVSGLSATGATSTRLAFVLRALEEALREARRQIVKD